MGRAAQPQAVIGNARQSAQGRQADIQGVDYGMYPCREGLPSVSQATGY